MRNYLQLLQSAIGDYNLTDSGVEFCGGNTYFNCYSLTLPERFRGLPSIWYFAVLIDQNPDMSEPGVKNDIVNAARDIVTQYTDKDYIPLAFLCDDDRIRLSNAFRLPREAIFFLDKADLAGRNAPLISAKETPIVLAIRNKFASQGLPPSLVPYTPNLPVNTWRFFGRKKELTELVESTGNYFVIGARRIGKTSLLQEIKWQLEKRGHTVYWISVQQVQSVQGVIEEIANNLSVKELYKAQKASKVIDVHYLSSVIKRLRGDKKKITFIFDELGNVLARSKRDDWNFMGTLREFSHLSKIRVIASAFQEIFIKQRNEFEGPLVNFGNTIKINVFSSSEVDDILIHPLSFWGEIDDHQKLNRLIRNNFGSHPLIMQYLGQYLFQQIFSSGNKKVELLIVELLNTDKLLFFENAVDDLFRKNNSYLEKYVFLVCCQLVENNGNDLISTGVTQRDIKKILDDLHISSGLNERTLFLERLNLRGLLHPEVTNQSIYKIATPIIYTYLKKFDSPSTLCEEYREEIAENSITHLKEAY